MKGSCVSFLPKFRGNLGEGVELIQIRMKSNFSSYSFMEFMKSLWFAWIKIIFAWCCRTSKNSKSDTLKVLISNTCAQKHVCVQLLSVLYVESMLHAARLATRKNSAYFFGGATFGSRGVC